MYSNLCDVDRRHKILRNQLFGEANSVDNNVNDYVEICSHEDDDSSPIIYQYSSRNNIISRDQQLTSARWMREAAALIYKSRPSLAIHFEREAADRMLCAKTRGANYRVLASQQCRTTCKWCGIPSNPGICEHCGELTTHIAQRIKESTQLNNKKTPETSKTEVILRSSQVIGQRTLQRRIAF